MSAPKGNQFWKARSSHGRKPIFESDDDLWEAACEYFEWCENNPLNEDKLFSFQGEVVRDTVDLMRPFTQGGLCIFLDITQETYIQYRNRDGFTEVVSAIDEIIRDQKFAGAAVGLLNSNIIARDLGLKDSSNVDNTHSGPGGGVIKTAVIATEMDANQAAEIYQDLMKDDI